LSNRAVFGAQDDHMSHHYYGNVNHRDLPNHHETQVSCCSDLADVDFSRIHTSSVVTYASSICRDPRHPRVRCRECVASARAGCVFDRTRGQEWKDPPILLRAVARAFTSAATTRCLGRKRSGRGTRGRASRRCRCRSCRLSCWRRCVSFLLPYAPVFSDGLPFWDSEKRVQSYGHAYS
jgi:hypothetical protein